MNTKNQKITMKLTCFTLVFVALCHKEEMYNMAEWLEPDETRILNLLLQPINNHQR